MWFHPACGQSISINHIYFNAQLPLDFSYYIYPCCKVYNPAPNLTFYLINAACLVYSFEVCFG